MAYKYKYKVHKPVSIHKKNKMIPQGVSTEEIELRNAIALEFPNMPIYQSDRTVLHGREIDIYLPTRKIGIEFNGNYFHNSNSKDEWYHLWKTIEGEKQGVRIIHIFSDEWELKKPLVLDLIKKTLGKYQDIGIQDCIIKAISNKEGKYFLDNACLLGDDPSAEKYLGIFYNNTLIGVFSYIEKKDQVELIRYADRPFIKIKDAINYFCSLFSKTIIYKLDRRLYSASDFVLSGFKQVEATQPNIYYTKDFKHRFTEQQLNGKIDPGYVKIYDCGNIIYKKSPNK